MTVMELDKKDKAYYVSPTVLVVTVKTESHICVNSNQEGQGNGFNGWN